MMVRSMFIPLLLSSIVSASLGHRVRADVVDKLDVRQRRTSPKLQLRKVQTIKSLNINTPKARSLKVKGKDMGMKMGNNNMMMNMMMTRKPASMRRTPKPTTSTRRTMKPTTMTRRTMKPTTPQTMKPTFEPTLPPTGKPGQPTPPPTVTPTGKPGGPTPPKFKPGNTYPAIHGQTRNLRPQGGQNTEIINTVCGSIQAVLAHPTNADICFAGATNGGVWRTTTCMSALPDWQPLTDDQDSLSVADIVLDGDDVSSNTILVAVGTRSSFYGFGGPAIGLLYSKDVLAPQPTWQVLDNQAGVINFRDYGVKFRSAFVRGSLMLATAYVSNTETADCTTIGVFRSADGGSTWINVLSGVGFALAADPNDPNRFYATLNETSSTCNSGKGFPSNGVFTSADAGVTWTFTSTMPGQLVLANAKLSVSSSSSRIWSAQTNGRDEIIAYSDNHGTTWVKMDPIRTRESDNSIQGLNPYGQGAFHFSLLASPTNPDEVYVGGDTQNGSFPFLPNFIGAVDSTGRLFRGDASVAASDSIPSKQWEHLTDNQSIVEIPEGGTASESAPHADARDMEIRADGSLLEVSDGGITVRTFPHDNTGDWFGLCGNMQVFETHSIAYEPLGGLVLFANQDTATIMGNLGQEDTFKSIFKGDGSLAMIDYTSDPDFSFFYLGIEFLQHGLARIKEPKTPGDPGVDVIGTELDERGGFVVVTAMNPADQKVFVLAVSAPPDQVINQIALTMNRGDNFVEVPSQLTKSITSMVWSKDGSVLYVASDNNFARCAYTLGTTTLICTALVATVDGIARQLAVNPDNSNELYAVTTLVDLSDPKVFITTNGGASWIDSTIVGSSVDLAARGGAVAFIKKGTTSAVIVGTSNGVYVLKSGTTWKLLAAGLPKVPILGMLYEEVDDRLVLSTLGRGVWYLETASNAASSVLTGIMQPFVPGPRYNGVTAKDIVVVRQNPVPPIALIQDGAPNDASSNV